MLVRCHHKLAKAHGVDLHWRFEQKYPAQPILALHYDPWQVTQDLQPNQSQRFLSIMITHEDWASPRPLQHNTALTSIIFEIIWSSLAGTDTVGIPRNKYSHMKWKCRQSQHVYIHVEKKFHVVGIPQQKPMYTESRSEEVLPKKQQHPLFSSRHEISMSRRSPWEFFSFEMQYWGLNQIEREREERGTAGSWKMMTHELTHHRGDWRTPE